MTLTSLAHHAERVAGIASRIERPHRWVPIRTLHEWHRPKMRAHLLALDSADRVLRFGHLVSDERMLSYAAQIDFGRDHVFGSFDRRLALVSMGHLAIDKSIGTGELGVSVLSRGRGRGLGSQLFDHAVTYARNRGLHTLYLHVARENAPMLAIVQRADAVIDFDGSEAVAAVPLAADTLGTQIEELLRHQAAEFDYRVKLHSLRLELLPAGDPSKS